MNFWSFYNVSPFTAHIRKLSIADVFSLPQTLVLVYALGIAGAISEAIILRL